jgi:type IV pilus assembly protein PilO
MNLSNINWDLAYAGSWPFSVKLAVIVVLSLMVAAVCYHLDTRALLESLEEQRNRERELRAVFENKFGKAVHLEEYRRQLAAIEKTFGDLLRRLPDRAEVPELLVDVSQTGVANGLEFELFKPSLEMHRDFYAELPIEIRVVGDYLKFASFVSGLASLPRIVTVHEVKIVPRVGDAAGKSGTAPLVMTAVVKTYRYLGDAVPPVSSPSPRPPG